MEDRERVQSVLVKVQPTLCTHLVMDTAFLLQLVAKDVLTTEERERAETIQVQAERVDYVIDILRRRSFTCYSSFMKIVQQNDEVIYRKCAGIMEGLPGELRFAFEVLNLRLICLIYVV